MRNLTLNIFHFCILLTVNILLSACGGGDETISAPQNPQAPQNPSPNIVPTYINLRSDTGDYIGAGRNYSHTQADTQISVSSTGGRLTVRITGDENWTGDFQLPAAYSELQAGSYSNLTRYPFHDAAFGGISWSGEGRGCNTLTGWLIIDSVTYAGNALTAIDLSFEQHCEGGAPALHGEIHWTAADTTTPPGPVNPPPTNLWQANPNVTPQTGNYVYLESQVGDYIGAGGNYLYTPADSILSVSAAGGRLTVSINGDESWRADFQAMNTLNQLQPGYYGNLQRYPFHNPVKGGLSWSGEGRGYNTLTGWFVVDSVTYDSNGLTAIDLRFAQHCEGGMSALHGQIHWRADDATSSPGPVNPIPAGLWDADPNLLPASGNYVYLESDAGDYIGAGGNYLYTDPEITITDSGARLSVTINGTENWSATFQGMNSINYLEVGYYGDLQRYPFHNPVKGGLSWSGQGRGCNTLTGWFVVDSVTYVGIDLVAIDLRFEQHCEGGIPALHGKIHWNM